ncbi:MAG: 2Fe-2S iron-sulfur cluster binding domain-containing protein [Pseudomonadales bacterium]|nr:2Fe-2S iron-sulfur cluster binding domain-containing protein [Pseudomonadales bacterium]
MPTVYFVTLDGDTVAVDGDPGDIVMELARAEGIEGIDAECGGGCACATCHVHVDPDWMPIVGPPSEIEQDMLAFDGEVAPTSRLSCQIELTDELDGLRLKVVGR